MCSSDSKHGKKNLELVSMINKYRKGLEVEELECDEHLAETARVHVKNSDSCPEPEKPCQLHSWCKSGYLGKKVKTCCYEGDDDADCMYHKVKEITGSEKIPVAFEISTSFSGKLTKKMAFENWKKSPHHNAVMSAEGHWSSMKKIGCFHSSKFAHCWFAP